MYGENMAAVLLDVKNITMQFGGLKAVDSLSFQIQEGQLAGLIGPNGAGKTTVFNMLTGVYTPTVGEVALAGEKISGLRPYEICGRGLTRTFQNIRLFKGLTVLENVLVAGHQHVSYSLWDALSLSKKFNSEEAELTKKAMDLLGLFGLSKKRDEKASSLPYGEQRKLEIVRAMMTKPKMICLDEPAAGMNHSETHALMDLIARVRREFGLTVLLIEHDMKLVMGICENIVVLDHGCKIEEGKPEHIQKSKKVIEAYLGVEDMH
jgi:branched-chain amino acid transport system ATP-binding protein